VGVDARIIVALDAPISDEDILVAAVKLATVFGPGNFRIWEADKFADGEPARHALSRLTDPGSIGSVDRAIECHLHSSYYGPGYERGNILTILGVCEWLERWAASRGGGQVYYGGDDCEPDLYSPELREALWAHVMSDESRAFYTKRRTDGTFLCPTCAVHPFNTKNRPDHEYYTCAGCDQHWILYADGRRVLRSRKYGSNMLLVPSRDVLEELLRAVAAMTLGDAEIHHALMTPLTDGTYTSFDIVSRWQLLTDEEKLAARERAITLLSDRAQAEATARRVVR
jgi:hypothetical protein